MRESFTGRERGYYPLYPYTPKGYYPLQVFSGYEKSLQGKGFFSVKEKILPLYPIGVPDTTPKGYYPEGIQVFSFTEKSQVFS